MSAANWRGKTALITGAGSGFGLELARLAARAGMRLVLVDVQADALAASVAEQRAAGALVMPFELSVADANAMQAMAEQVEQQWGAPHLLFNNAGVGSGGLIWENSLDDWQWVLGVNLMGVVHGVRLFTPMMLEAAHKDPAWRGHIVNTASMAGLLNPPNMGVYNVSKHAVVSLTETLHHDLSLVSEQIAVSLLCPYFVATGISQSHRNRPAAGQRATRSQRVGQAMMDKAVQSGKVSAAEVAERTFAAIASGQFYVYSHPQALASVQTRMEDIVQGRTPSDPFAGRPQVREQLRDALRGD
ncbi:MAG: SDR family oxidoreductase [Comamonadaceae bacterium]|jgi:NAD(P)-dependent dehydrogenase (short-subunit alcohol dehydrogenase family)|nr:SDR family oxidoreductase [Comamonadaceae bacterium]